MLWLFHSIALILIFSTRGYQAFGNEKPGGLSSQPSESNVEQIRSPTLEVFEHIPPKFRDVKSFENSLETQQLRLKREAKPKWKGNATQKRIFDVRNYEITQAAFLKDPQSAAENTRRKRETESAKEVKAISDKPASEKLVSSLAGSQPMLPLPDAIRGPIFKTYPVKEFDIIDIDDPEDPRRRRNDSLDGPDDNSQRDKRTFLEEASGESTTPLPFWKRKKENPPFVTGRGSAQSGNTYTPAQHRSPENARESHSLKNLQKTIQSNEISRSNQDNYYSATNRRTYSRQFDSSPSSTPKSVYDTIDYSQKKNQEPLRAESGRNRDEKKETLREARPTHEQYTNRQIPYHYPWMYDRPYYQPAYPYPTEVLGRGVEYYHRTYDPTTGRIVYYANMPEQGRSYEYRYMDPTNRNFYVNRAYDHDPYYRNYVPPFDYRFGPAMGYLRNGRSSSQAYSYPFQEREKFPRDARFNGAFETGNRLKDDFRNKTYIIYDAEENKSQFPRQRYTPDNNRPGFTPAPNSNPSRPQVPFRQFSFPSLDYFPSAPYHFRNQFYPSSPGPVWGFSHRSVPGVTDSNLNSRPLNSPEVQLPLTTSSRGELDKSNKS